MSPKLTRRNLLFGARASAPALGAAAQRRRPTMSGRGEANAASVPEAAAPRLVAQIQPFDCLARRGQVCTVCAERCPVPAAVRVTGTRVEIVAEHCTGCGICQQVCPAPQNAILLWPGR